MHLYNEKSPIFEIEEGIEMCVSDEQSLNISLSIDAKEEGIAIWTSDEHPLKAPLLITVTDDGIAI